MQINQKDVELKRATLLLTAQVEELMEATDLFRPLTNLPSISRKDPEKFAKLQATWKAFVNLVLVTVPEGADDLNNVLYPDEVVELHSSFFTMPWVKTEAKFRSLREDLRGLNSLEKQ